MRFKRLESRDKLFGMYATPPSIARLLAEYALGDSARTVIELGTGEGAFIGALDDVNLRAGRRITYTGVERDPGAVGAARIRLRGTELDPGSAVVQADAFTLFAKEPCARYDAAVGNPPYIRYQYLDEEQQNAAEALFARLGVPFTRHTNAWTTFVLAAFEALRPGGRLALIVPSEILHVLHARGTRNYLRRWCSQITVVDIDDMLFDALQGAVLVLAQRKPQHATAPDGELRVARFRDLGSLPENVGAILAAARPASEGEDLGYKWMGGLLSVEERAAIEELRARGSLVAFAEVAGIDVGIVTGANAFFLVDASTVRRYGLEPFVIPAFGRSEHIRGAVLTKEDHARNVAAGLPSYLLALPPDAKPRTFPASLRRYLDEGRAQGLPLRYKCRIRDPWWSVPSVYASPVAMLKRSNDVARLVLNAANAVSTDTAYRIAVRNADPARFVGAFVNSVTALSAEMNGRHYGGGVLELVPSEAERLLVPARRQRASLPRLDALIRAKRPASEVLARQDARLFTAGERPFVEIIHAAWERLRRRRRRTTIAERDQAATTA